MRRIKFFLVFLFVTMSVSAQNISPQFSELKGMEDNSGNTHLFYRIYSSSGTWPSPTTFNNDIYHLDLESGLDTLFLYDGGYSDFLSGYSKDVSDYEFWNNDPSKYIYSGTEIGMEPYGYIRRFYDSADLPILSFGISNIEISNTNDSLLLATKPLYKSVDGGKKLDGFEWYHKFKYDFNVP